MPSSPALLLPISAGSNFWTHWRRNVRWRKRTRPITGSTLWNMQCAMGICAPCEAAPPEEPSEWDSRSSRKADAASCKTHEGRPPFSRRPQPVEKPALAIRPEQVFCLKTRRQEEKAVKCQAHFRAIWTVCRHPVPDGGHSISRWPAFSDSWQQI